MLALNHLIYVLIFTTVVSGFINGERYNASSEAESLLEEQAASLINETTIDVTAGNNTIGDGNETHIDTHAIESQIMGQNPELASNRTGIKFPPTFKHPSKMYLMDMKPTGSSIRLKCAADGNPTPNITWSKNDAPVARAYSQPSYSNWSMTIEELTKTDEGNYTCLVCNELGCISHTVVLNVQGYNASSEAESLLEEQAASLINETTIDVTAGNNTIGDGNETHIDTHAIETQIMGQNPELASNRTGIKFPPTFQHPSKMYLMDMKPTGSSIRLKCAADGNPTPNITWSKNDAPVARAYSQPSYSNWSMTIEELTKTDEGNYTCRVCNELGCISHTVVLHVQGYNASSEAESLLEEQAASLINETTIDVTAGNNTIGDGNETHIDTHAIESQIMGQNPELASNRTGIKFPPTFKHPSKMYLMDMKPTGSSIRLKCAADGNPTPNISWSKNDAPVARAYSQPSYSNWSMTIEELTKTDEGNYTCRVCNELGCISHTVVLNVQERVYSKPVLIRGAVNQTKLVGETAHFSCEFLSDMHSDIIWSRLVEQEVYDSNGTTNSENNRIMTTIRILFHSEDPNDRPENLTIFNVAKAHEGWYICVGINVLGMTSTQGYLTVLDSVPVRAVPHHERYPSRPSVKEGFPGNKTAFVNNTVRLTCPILSELDYFLYWLKLANNYIGNSHVGAEELIPEGLVIQSDDDSDKPEVLTLFNVTKEERGWYVCVALNTLGRASAKGYLTVLDRNNRHNKA